jgi:hypothetical protein
MKGRTLENVSRVTKKENNNELSFKTYDKWLFIIHLKVKRPDTPLVEGRKEKKWGQFDIFSVMTKSKISFHSIRELLGLLGK